MLKKYLNYIKDNPQGYWFKRKLYGWGWMPAKPAGWIVVAVAVFIIAIGSYLAETDDAPGLLLLSIVLSLFIVIGFGYLKGEKPRWQWGFPYYQCPICGLRYREQKWAKACESWCREHHSCNLEIIAHAVQQGELKENKK